MTINAGVWIDHHKAIVVLLMEKGEDLHQILSECDVSTKTSGVERTRNSYSPNDFVAEDKRERKGTAHLNHYYDRVIEHLHDAKAIVILGPGEAKGELRTRIEHKKLRGRIAELKTIDKLTDHQIADFVRQHFQ